METKQYAWDYNQENETEAFFWPAKIVSGAPEPHCYRLLWSADGAEAIEMITRFNRMSHSQCLSIVRDWDSELE